ncbi:triose-phosphate transporter family-domain-containing protein [Cytidiella melzeri]|nr:triose-phosphate transporter family-domain-containing protein [Cytidiella melzeri]
MHLHPPSHEDHHSDTVEHPTHDEERTPGGPRDGRHLATVEEKKRRWWRNAFINMAFISSWFLFATLLSLYNKWMFAPDHYGFPFPLFVTTMHMFVQFGLAALARAIWPNKFVSEHTPTRKDYVTQVVPTGLTTALDIGLSNLSLKTITLSFYTMVKSSSLIFVLLFAFLFRLEVFSLRLVGVIAIIFAGVLLMVATQTHFILGGFLLVLSGSAIGGLRWSLTQLLLKDKKLGMDNSVATIYWLAPIMGTFLLVISVSVDHLSDLPGSRFFDSIGSTLKTCFFLTAPGLIAFCMILSEVTIIQRAGVVPMSIAGIAKEVSTITISAWFFGDELTPLNITGVAITTCGIGLFTYHKYRKSIDSKVPLDAHGNPIEDDDFEGDADSHYLHNLVDEERQPLAAAAEHESTRPTDAPPEIDGPLFKVDSDSDTEEPFMSADTSNENAHLVSLADVENSQDVWENGRKGSRV